MHQGEAITTIQARLDHEATIDNLATKTKNVMITTYRSYLKSKMEEP
jgi:hypothetical protein